MALDIRPPGADQRANAGEAVVGRGGSIDGKLGLWKRESVVLATNAQSYRVLLRKR